MNRTTPKPPRSVTWLALSLALGYLALMATVMWLFERAVTLEDIAQLFDNPRLKQSWAVIALSAAGIFMLARWALLRIATPAPRSADGLASGPDERAAGSQSPATEHRLDKGLVTFFLVALAVILIGTGSFIVKEQEATLDAARYRSFALIGQSKARSVARWVDERQRDLQVLLENPRFVGRLGLWLARPGGNDELQADLVADIEGLLKANGFDGMAVLTRKGKIGIRLPEDTRAWRMCLIQASSVRGEQGRAVGLSFAFDDSEGKPLIDVIGKAFERIGELQRHIATLCMRVDLNSRLLPMVSRWPGVAASGEVLLGRADGRDMVVLNGRAAADEGWRIERIEGGHALWDAALAMAAGNRLHEATNPGGVVTLHAAYPVPGTPWLLKVKMDAAESHHMHLRWQMRASIIIGFVLIFVVAAFAIAWARTSYSRDRFQVERDALLAQLHEMAYYDDLTGLPSRRLLQDRLDVAVRDADRRKETVGVLFIDLDKFKAVNDSHGHAAGDFVLQTIAQRLQHSVRINDSAGRLSGDEFLVILTGNADAAMLSALREKITQDLASPIAWEGQVLKVGISSGLAVFPDDASSAQELIGLADQAMYRDKDAQR